MKDSEPHLLTPEEAKEAKALAEKINKILDGVRGPVVISTLAALVGYGISLGMCDVKHFVATMMLDARVYKEVMKEVDKHVEKNDQ